MYALVWHSRGVAVPMLDPIARDLHEATGAERVDRVISFLFFLSRFDRWPDSIEYRGARCSADCAIAAIDLGGTKGQDSASELEPGFLVEIPGRLCAGKIAATGTEPRPACGRCRIRRFGAIMRLLVHVVRRFGVEIPDRATRMLGKGLAWAYFALVEQAGQAGSGRPATRLAPLRGSTMNRTKDRVI